MGVSKVIYGGQTLIDLTNDTVTKDKLLKGYTAHGKDGEVINGACEYDVNSSGATATVDEVLSGKTFAKGGSIQTGKMKNNGGWDGTIGAADDSVEIPQGYHDGSGRVELALAEQEKLIPENIRGGVTILGVQGTMSGTEDAKPQAKTVTPKPTAQQVLPDTNQGYNYLSQVTVEPIPYVESDNNAGGKTVTIG